MAKYENTTNVPRANTHREVFFKQTLQLDRLSQRCTEINKFSGVTVTTKAKRANTYYSCSLDNMLYNKTCDVQYLIEILSLPNGKTYHTEYLPTARRNEQLVGSFICKQTKCLVPSFNMPGTTRQDNVGKNNKIKYQHEMKKKW